MTRTRTIVRRTSRQPLRFKRPAALAAFHALERGKTNWGLPDMDGQMVVAGLRQKHGRQVPVLLITADGWAALKARQAGAFAYLHKPFELTDLIAAVQRGLELG